MNSMVPKIKKKQKGKEIGKIKQNGTVTLSVFEMQKEKKNVPIMDL